MNDKPIHISMKLYFHKGILDGEIEVGTTNEDPQRMHLLAGSWESCAMGGVWDSRLDYRFFDIRFFTHLSFWLRDIFGGHFLRFMAHFEGYII